MGLLEVCLINFLTSKSWITLAKKNIKERFFLVLTLSVFFFVISVNILRPIGTIDTQSNLTSFGLKTSKLEVGPMMGKIIVCSEKYGCGKEIIRIAMMSYETL